MRSFIDGGESKGSSTGWGISQTRTLAEAKVFVKRVPVTQREHDNLFSTANLYRLPPFCSYGLGSPGFNVFRELVMHLETTQWVLQGETASFPLLHHYRLLPHSGTHAEVDRAAHRDLVESWNGNQNVGQYALDRAKAPYELILCLEHFPHVLESWLRDNPGKLRQSVEDVGTTIAFLQARGIIHFDAHFGNILTDGHQTYLSDFGLALDQSFALGDDERRFFEQHTDYDTGELLRNLGRVVLWPYVSASGDDQQRIRERYDIPHDLEPHELGPVLLDNIESIHKERLLELDPDYVKLVVKHRGAIALAHGFFCEMWHNNAKDTPFPQRELRRLLEETESCDTNARL